MRVDVKSKSEKLELVGIQFHQRQTVVDLHPETAFEAPTNASANTHIGSSTKIGAFTLLNMPTIANAEIGRYCSIATGVYIGSAEHPIDRLTSSTYGFNRDFKKWRSFLERQRGEQKMRVAPFNDRARSFIGNDVWVGQNAFIKAGVRIGNGAIVAAGAVVIKDVEPYSIVGGIPAKHIRYRFPHDVIQRLESLAWWRYPISEFSGIDIADIFQSLDWLERNMSGLSPYAGKWWTAEQMSSL